MTVGDAPVGQGTVPDPAEDLVELRLGDQEGVVLRIDGAVDGDEVVVWSTTANGGRPASSRGNRWRAAPGPRCRGAVPLAAVIGLATATSEPMPRSRLATGVYRSWRAHVRALVRLAEVGDPDTLADILLAPLAPEVYRHQRHDAGLSEARISRSLAVLADRLLGAD